MKTPKLSWGHININVSDLDTSIFFYEKLGFSLFES
jgi:predicted lactoylglutathione lyase